MMSMSVRARAVMNHFRQFPVLLRIRSNRFTTYKQFIIYLKQIDRHARLIINRSKFRFVGTGVVTAALGGRAFSFWSSTEPEEKMAEDNATSPEDVAVKEADELYHNHEIHKLYKYLGEFKDTENPLLLWRLARASRDVAQHSHTDPETSKRLTYEALEYSKRALELDDTNFACHKWYAICISDVGDYEGSKKKILNAFKIQEHFKKAIELNPKDATSYHLLGLWCFTFADLPWYQKKAAAVIFTTPPESSFEEALSYFSKAEEVEPNFYSKNLLMLGKTYIKLNNLKMALLYLTKARDYPAKTEEDLKVREETEQLLPKLTTKKSN
ncbi:regulator of microtubule dynamics protein 1-like [Antedon mediterranea]|uniref:regulator of microtubule dynamics protein 1-like n=1 Tax=Antedon mediterranea TaxID=105859 RepID=UPI003AF62B63